MTVKKLIGDLSGRCLVCQLKRFRAEPLHADHRRSAVGKDAATEASAWRSSNFTVSCCSLFGFEKRMRPTKVSGPAHEMHREGSRDCAGPWAGMRARRPGSQGAQRGFAPSATPSKRQDSMANRAVRCPGPLLSDQTYPSQRWLGWFARGEREERAWRVLRRVPRADKEARSGAFLAPDQAPGRAAARKKGRLIPDYATRVRTSFEGTGMGLPQCRPSYP